MFDFIKRICIAVALAMFIGILFASTMTAKAANEDEIIWPTEGHISDYYGSRDGKHYGIDLAAPTGTEVFAIADGVVSRSYYSTTYGYVIFVEHINGLEGVYAHLHERFVEEGQAVAKEEVIGTVGSTGRSSGSHLHFELHEGNWNETKSNSFDPLLVLGEGSENEHIVVSAQVNEEAEELQKEAKVVTIPIEKGDTLWAISAHYDVSIAEIMEWNHLKSDLIIAGEQLVIQQST